MIRWATILILAALATPATAADRNLAALDLEPGEQVSIDTAIDGQTLRLKDGRELRLAAIEAPEALRPRLTVRAREDAGLATLIAAAQSALHEIADGQEAVLHYEQQHSDRYGRIIAHVETIDGVWLQAELLTRGMARVHTTPELATAAAALLRREAEARAAHRGMWAHPAFRIRSPDEMGRWLDSFQIVEGMAANLRQTRNRAWIDFEGEPGKTVSLAITPAARTRLRAAHVDLQSLRGTRLRVRGWIRWLDGPLIDIDHPAQIEIVEQ